MSARARPRVLVDADALLAASASPSEHGASLVILRMAEITLIEACIPQQVLTEVQRNLEAKSPQALPAMQMIVARCLTVLPDATASEIVPYLGLAHERDLPILVTALKAQCPWLVTLNGKHFRPGHSGVVVVTPGEFLMQVRDILAHPGSRASWS
jgi:predicted nucleic acid-binding protein